MSVLEWIEIKKKGGSLSRPAIESLVDGLVDGSVPDYQAAALLMAIYFRGMDEEETAALTDAMVKSGAVLDLKGVQGPTVDKHSTGGVGDKVSLPLAPAVAACGGHIPMISGRALGHTGGTLDKLETITGFRTALSHREVARQVTEIGLAFAAATTDLAPADSRLYRLRDATNTVDSIPLITSSILSKKAAEGIEGLVLDVKTGSGAIMPDLEDAMVLARTLVNTADRLSLRTVALVSDMSQPLGSAVGNALEVAESIEILKGGGPDDVVELTAALGGEMLVLSGLAEDQMEGRDRITAVLGDGSALSRFRSTVERQGGDPAVVDSPERLPQARHCEDICANETGFVTAIDCRALGTASRNMGAGRAHMEDEIDHGAGLLLTRKVGDSVRKGDCLMKACFDNPAKFAAVRGALENAMTIEPESKGSVELILARITPEHQETGHG